MNRTKKRLLASLLAAALLALPGPARAAEPGAPAEPAERPAEPAEPAERPAQPAAPDERPVEQLAELNVTREQAIAIAQQTFTIPADLGAPNARLDQSREGATWSLEWASSEKEPDQRSVSVGVDAVSGRVVSYNTWSSRQEAAALAYTIDEARKVAEKWFAQLVPADLQPAFRFVDLPMSAGYWGGTTYRFSWERVEQGYPVADGGVTIAIDARTGDLAEYNLGWRDGLAFVPPEALISQADAEAALRAHLGMTLQYRYYTERGTDEGDWRLVYEPRNAAPYIDQEGRLIGHDGEPVAPAPEPRAITASDRPYQKPAAPLDREAALVIARAATGRTDPPTAVAQDERGTDAKTLEWSFTWKLGPGGEKAGEILATVDATTGVLTHMGSWRPDDGSLKEGEEPPVSRAEAEPIAIEFVRTHRPDLSGRILYVPEPPLPLAKRGYTPSSHSFRFVQLQNGLPVEGREMTVAVDARTGAVRYFWAHDFRQGEEEFPVPEAVIGVQKALDAYLSAEGLRLAWVRLRSPEQDEPLPPQLLWAREDRLPVSAIDALTGAPLDSEGRDLIEAARRPVDIAGHYAEREIELLWNRGVFDLVGGEFNPDQPATAAELARWIVLAKGMRPYVAYDFAARGAGAPLAAKLANSAESPYFGAAFQAGIMRPEDFPEGTDPEGPVTRELFALWAARAMGYTRVTTMTTRIEMTFADRDQVGAKYANAVALLAGFGVLSGDAENRVNPQAILTRSEAAKILYAVTAEPRY